MASRKTNIHIEKFGTSENEFKIYSDLPDWKIAGVEGVANVSNVMRDEGYSIAIIDKRYDIKEVLAEIRQLAEEV